MSGRIEEILIVGGGTAGWMSAVYLNRALGSQVRITLVESKAVPTIGVGEATFNTVKGFFDYVGLQEHEWMPPCQAAYKLAIKFVNWRSSGRAFYHPFQRQGDINGVSLLEWWLKIKRRDEPFDYACFNVPDLCDTKRSPKYLDGTIFDKSTLRPYAYHFDATLLAKFLAKVGIARGVKRIYGDVATVSLGSSGEIDCVRLADGQQLRADLFIDCTGFRGLLINQTLGEPFIPFSRSLFCDRAIAMRIPTDGEVEGINPYTTATALSSGWVWDIPLYGRVGTGYVYSSSFIDQEDAERELRTHLGPKADNVDANHIRMRIGRNRNSWVKNCVSVGLSSGFVEPLESTGIFFIQHALVELVNHFPDRRFCNAIIRNYNEAVGQCIDGVRDFLILHYYTGDRLDTEFWRAVKVDLDIPACLRDRLQLWKTRLPNLSSINPYYHGFAPYSYCVMLLGLGYEPGESLPILDYFEDHEARRVFEFVKERSRQLTTTLPSHYEYLTALYEGRPGPAS